ncbi:sigma-54-dependent transcriptional regulator [Longimicrobium terrae]|uniref:Two-component system response regulator HydG n=1 Tax=Longimicrobium terrae TaxID=1639882 RepID=A0A841H3L2_9BACT|nr:sigma-54 dependent transcriptional regulator [Longimicrobium terrae]MBB4638037.1 two-component system response regulator HydG [Longimicrobium terrae]MBB6072409.1 two-component system response regulator HydG [Longimicrobium terrae]NNC32177.1 sigma-54-dependent Fis family transcriptional regulator [Longimicrobium terrae]
MPRTVLVVDDDPGVLRVLSRYFSRGGWEVHEADSGEEGLRRWESARPDVVLLDLDLPGMSGREVLDVLVSRGASVIMLTGHTEVETAVDAMQAGAETFLTKPVDFAHVGAAAERAAEKQELRRTNETLARSLAGRTEDDGLGASPGMRALARQVSMLSASADTTALLLGESGTGKSWVAQMIHARSPRARGPFVEINCAGLSGTFLDSELFGHERGAFTDAREMKRGLFEVADRGTLFLDEIGDLSPELQPKLLKVLEQRTFRRLGGTREMTVDVRLLAATNKDLQAEVRAGRFREDLFYRLSVFPLTIPPLRERSREDVMELVHRSLVDLGKRHPGAPHSMAPRASEALSAYAWPGNVRELRNVLERALVLAVGSERIDLEHLPEALRARNAAKSTRNSAEVLPLAEVERRHIERALHVLGGNRSLAAEKLGISRSTLHAKIQQHGLEKVGKE